MEEKSAYYQERDSETERMVSLWKEGYSVHNIAKEVKRSCSTVADRLEEAGVRKKPAPGSAYAVYTEDELNILRDFASLSPEKKRWKDIMAKLPGRSKYGIETQLRRMLNQSMSKYAGRPIAKPDNTLDVPPGWYRSENGVVLKHVSIQGDKSSCYKPREVTY